MEKASRLKGSIFAFLPKTAHVSFSNPPFSPGSDKHKPHPRGFSGPIISIIPVEARTKQKNSGFDEEQEPTSPKVSCIGQIKHKKMNKEKKKKMMMMMNRSTTPPPKRDRKSSFNLGKILRRRSVGGDRKSDADAAEMVAEESEPAPSLGQMKRFASGRERLGDFDWRAVHGAPVADHFRGYHSDEEIKGRDGDDFDDDGDDDDDGFSVPHSAPLGLGGPMGPRKEVNLWKRRTMAPPVPLQLKDKANIK